MGPVGWQPGAPLDGSRAAIHDKQRGIKGAFEMTLQGIRKRLHRSRDRASKLEYLLAEKTAELVAADTVVTERAALAIELKQLTEEKVQLEGEIDQLEYDYANADREYQRYREYIASRTQN